MKSFSLVFSKIFLEILLNLFFFTFGLCLLLINSHLTPSVGKYKKKKGVLRTVGKSRFVSKTPQVNSLAQLFVYFTQQ